MAEDCATAFSPPTQRSRFDDDIPAAVHDSDHEVHDYMTAAFDTSGLRNDQGRVDVGKFWAAQEAAGRYPNIRKVAARLLALPASTAEAERTFSKLQYVLQKRRQGMEANTVNEAMVSGSLLALERTF